MKKIFILLATVLITFCVAAQSKPTEEMMRQWRQTVQKRDISQRHIAGIPQAAETKGATKSTTGMPNDSF